LHPILILVAYLRKVVHRSLICKSAHSCHLVSYASLLCAMWLARTHEHTLRRIPFIRTPEAIVIASTQQPCTQWAQVAFSSVRCPVKF